MNKIIYMFILSMLPVLEIRGSMIYALANNINPALAFGLSVIGHFQTICGLDQQKSTRKKQDYRQIRKTGTLHFGGDSTSWNRRLDWRIGGVILGIKSQKKYASHNTWSHHSRNYRDAFNNGSVKCN